MPSLRDIQEGMRRSLVARDDAIAAFVADDGLAATERLDIYRNTFVSVATRALRLNHPAILRLVGDDFFDATAQSYVREHPPASAWLDQYGEAFADFLGAWPAARSIPYLADVARLERAVTCALHAPNTPALAPAALASLAALAPDAQADVRFIAHPALQLVHTAFPVDAIWRAVLERDDAALAAIDIAAGPQWLLVERADAGVEVVPMREAEWRFTQALCTGQPLQQALDASGDLPDVDPPMLIARHLAAGRFTGFRLAHPVHPAQLEGAPT